MIKSILSSIVGVLPRTIERVLDRTLPASMSDAEKAEVRKEMLDVAHQHELSLLVLSNEAEAMFNKRTADMEGTAADLKAMPILGPIMMFMRGAFRPLFAFAVLVWDWQVLSGAWKTEHTELLFAVNVLVLGFFFGERAVKNIAPLLQKKLGQ